PGHPMGRCRRARRWRGGGVLVGDWRPRGCATDPSRGRAPEPWATKKQRSLPLLPLRLAAGLARAAMLSMTNDPPLSRRAAPGPPNRLVRRRSVVTQQTAVFVHGTTEYRAHRTTCQVSRWTTFRPKEVAGPGWRPPGAPTDWWSAARRTTIAPFTPTARDA